MKLLSPKLPERILKRLSKHPMAVLGVATLGLKVGRDAANLKQGKIDSPEFRKRTGGHVGSVGLGAAGSYAGLTLGVFLSPVPVLGGLLGGFAGNALRFHSADGSGYAFIADQILRLDPKNPQVAARLLKAFGRWRRFDPDRQALMRAELDRIAAAPDLSPDCREIVDLSLAG